MPHKYVKIDVTGMCSDIGDYQGNYHGNVMFNMHYDYPTMSDVSFRDALERYIKDAKDNGLVPLSITMEEKISHSYD